MKKTVKNTRSLSPDQVREIRKIRKDNLDISFVKIAKMYGVHYSTIRRVCIGQNYKDVV